MPDSGDKSRVPINEFDVSQLNKYIKYINFVIIYIVTFTLVCIPKYEIVGMGLLLSFNFIIQSFLLYDIFSLNTNTNNIFIFVIVFGIVLTFLSSFYILKMLVRTQNKNREVGNIKHLIDKNTNPKYHLFSNLFITNVGLIIVNAIIFFIYNFTINKNYANDYLYNELDYEYINYSFFENIYYKSWEYAENKFGSLSVLLYPFIFLIITFRNIILALILNFTKTLYGLFTKFLHTFIFLFKSASLIAIVILSLINFYLATQLGKIRFKKIHNYDSKSNEDPTDSSKNNGIFSKIGDIFQNLNMNYLLNYKVVS
jgi:hypothetical protein